MGDDEPILVDDGLEILDEDECLRLLGTTEIGRVGVDVGALPAIFPVNYALIDGAVVFRTGDGAKLRAATRHAIVAFQADHADAAAAEGWSVQAVGVAEEVTETCLSQPPPSPWVGGDRAHIVRIRPQLLSGRRFRSESGSVG
jgi:hypothetical protein